MTDEVKGRVSEEGGEERRLSKSERASWVDTKPPFEPRTEQCSARRRKASSEMGKLRYSSTRLKSVLEMMPVWEGSNMEKAEMIFE